jgi:Holliday junction resolvase RusA-like endonuclease
MSESDSHWPLKIVIPGVPIAKGRPRFGKGRVYTPAKTKEYENTIAWAAKAAMGRRKMLTGPVRLTITCVFSSKERGWHVSKPDLDNCVKAATDGMTGIIYKDDAQICYMNVSKINGLTDEVEIYVRPL